MKRAFHNKGLFVATCLVVTMAVSTFAGVTYTGELSGRLLISQSLNQLPYEYSAGTGNLLPSQEYENLSSALGRVNGVKDSEIRSFVQYNGNVSGGIDAFQVYGIPHKSVVYSGLRLLSGSLSPSPGEIYVWSASSNASRLHLADRITANLRLFVSSTKTVNITSTFVIGAFIDMDQRSLAQLIGLPSQLILANEFPATVALTDWNATLPSLIDNALAQGVKVDPFSTNVYLYVPISDYSSLDIQASATKAEFLLQQLQLQGAKFNVEVVGFLFLGTLQAGGTIIESSRLTLLLAALPALLVAWYLIATLFAVLWKQRKRDLALHMAKGFSLSQLLKMSFFEGVTIATIGTLMGIAVGISLSIPLAVTAGLTWQDIAIGQSSLYAVIFGFGTTVAFMVYPSWKVTQQPITQSLRNTGRLQQTNPSKFRILLWTASAIGLSGVIFLILILNSTPNSGWNLLAVSPAQNWSSLALPLVIPGSLLALWSLSKLVMNSRIIEHILSGVASPILRNTTWIAKRVLRRDASWLFRFALLFALIVSYMVLSTGFLSSQSDYAIRSAQTTIGSDIQVSVPILANDTLTASRALAIANSLKTWQGVSAITVEYTTSFKLSYGGTPGPVVPVKIVDPVSWPTAAYHQADWFTSDPTSLFLKMRSDSHTMILSKDYVLSVMLYAGQDPLGATLSFGVSSSNQSVIENLQVIGLFGPPLQTPHVGTVEQSWSYAPLGLFGSFSPVISGSSILIKVMGQSPATIRNTISSNFPGIDTVSVQDVLNSLPIYSNISVLGTVFSASLVPITIISFALISLVYESLLLEQEENTLLLVKGLSFSETRALSLGKFLAILAFFVPIASVIGYSLLFSLTDSLGLGQLTFVLIRPVVGILTPELILSYVAILLSTIVIAIVVEARDRVFSSDWRSKDVP